MFWINFQMNYFSTCLILLLFSDPVAASAGHPRKLGDLQNLSVLRAYAW